MQKSTITRESARVDISRTEGGDYRLHGFGRHVCVGDQVSIGDEVLEVTCIDLEDALAVPYVAPKPTRTRGPNRREKRAAAAVARRRRP